MDYSPFKEPESQYRTCVRVIPPKGKEAGCLSSNSHMPLALGYIQRHELPSTCGLCYVSKRKPLGRWLQTCAVGRALCLLRPISWSAGSAHSPGSGPPALLYVMLWDYWGWLSKGKPAETGPQKDANRILGWINAQISSSWWSQRHII